MARFNSASTGDHKTKEQLTLGSLIKALDDGIAEPDQLLSASQADHADDIVTDHVV